MNVIYTSFENIIRKCQFNLFYREFALLSHLHKLSCINKLERMAKNFQLKKGTFKAIHTREF